MRNFKLVSGKGGNYSHEFIQRSNGIDSSPFCKIPYFNFYLNFQPYFTININYKKNVQKCFYNLFMKLKKFFFIIVSIYLFNNLYIKRSVSMYACMYVYILYKSSFLDKFD